MWGDHQVETGGMGIKRIHLRQNKDRSWLNSMQGSGGQDSRGETVCGGGVQRYGNMWNCPFSGTCAQS